MSSALGYLIMAPVALLTVGSPIIGLGLVVAYTQFGWSLPTDWFFLVVLLQVAIVTVPVMPILFVWTARKREGWHVGLSGGDSRGVGDEFRPSPNVGPCGRMVTDRVVRAAFCRTRAVLGRVPAGEDRAASAPAVEGALARYHAGGEVVPEQPRRRP